MQTRSCMIVAPRVWCSNLVYQCIQMYHWVHMLDTRVYIDLSIKREGEQSCIIFGPHLPNCRKLSKCQHNADAKSHDCCPSRLMLKLGLWRYPNMALGALFGYECIHLFDHQTRGKTIMQHIWDPFAQVQWIYEGFFSLSFIHMFTCSACLMQLQLIYAI